MVRFQTELSASISKVPGIQFRLCFHGSSLKVIKSFSSSLRRTSRNKDTNLHTMRIFLTKVHLSLTDQFQGAVVREVMPSYSRTSNVHWFPIHPSLD